MRGKLGRVQSLRRGGRLIPAHAGKTSARRASPGNMPAHPRACGENYLMSSLVDIWVGSSPRMRGKPRGSRASRALKGLIPAHAGKTFSASARCRTVLAHPRACGENSVYALCTAFFFGSSPRMRGKRPRPIQRPHPSRLIPAHAGKTV